MPRGRPRRVRHGRTSRCRRRALRRRSPRRRGRRARAGGRRSRRPALGELDPPFADEDSLMPQFVAHLRTKRIADAFLPAFEFEARTFQARFRQVATEHLDSAMLEVHVQEGRLQSLSERALRNRRVGVQAFLDFLQRRRRARRRRRSPPPRRVDRPRSVVISVCRFYETDVRVDDFGVMRSADISVGGIYLERLTLAVRGTSLRLHFKLRSPTPTPSPPSRA